MRGPFGARLRNEIDWENRCFRQYQGKCSLLNEEGLCDLYLEGGRREGALPGLPAMIPSPRHVARVSGSTPEVLPVSCPCPEARETDPETSRDRYAIWKAESRGLPERFPGFDAALFQTLMKARGLCFRILQNREKPWRLRAAMTLAFARDLQQRIRRKDYAGAEGLFRRYGTERAWSWFGKKLLEPEEREASAGLGQDTLRHLLKVLETPAAAAGRLETVSAGSPAGGSTRGETRRIRSHGRAVFG